MKIRAWFVTSMWWSQANNVIWPYMLVLQCTSCVDFCHWTTCGWSARLFGKPLWHQLLAAAQSCSLAHQLRQSMTTLHVMFDLDPPTEICSQISFTKTGSDYIICRLCQLLILWLQFSL